MPRIEVEPGQLQSAGGRQAALAEQIMALTGPVEAAGADAAAGAGEAVAAAAISDCATAWSASFGMLAGSVMRLSANVGAAATEYTATDTNAMPAAPR